VQGATDTSRQAPGYLKAVWLEIFGPVFQGFPAETDPQDPPRSPGPAPHINFHEKSAPQTNSEGHFAAPRKSHRTAFRYPELD